MSKPPSYPLRIDDETRIKLETIAKANGRSLNTEIALRLEASLQAEDQNNIPPALEETMRRIAREVATQVMTETLTKTGKNA